MRILTYILLALAALAVVALSVANRHGVMVYGSPDLTDYGMGPPPEARVPLFLVVLLAMGLGFILGAAREYLREHKYRKRMRQRGREVRELEREVGVLKERQGLDEDDEIIALTSR